MTILLTGASGLVGAACARLAARQGHHVIGLVGRWSGPVPGAAEIRTVDLTNAAVVDELMKNVRPAAIVNAAAVAEPAACDADPQRAQQLNVDLPARLARAVAQTGTRLVHLSSEQVFDGEHAPYSIADTPRPLNLYGRQKAAAEELVLSAAPAACIVRPPLLLGNSLGGRRSLHERMLETWAARQVVRLYTDEIRQVCLADNLAAALLELVERRDLAGLFHWAGAEPVSRWTLGRAIAAHFSVEEKLLAPMGRADSPAVTATRPRDLSLNLAPLDRALQTKPLTLAEAVKELVVPEAIPAWSAHR
jgi:dTDP-4-dehydrorhamnose reductase